MSTEGGNIHVLLKTSSGAELVCMGAKDLKMWAHVKQLALSWTREGQGRELLHISPSRKSKVRPAPSSWGVSSRSPHRSKTVCAGREIPRILGAVNLYSVLY